jgi:hypothetical protein
MPKTDTQADIIMASMIIIRTAEVDCLVTTQGSDITTTIFTVIVIPTTVVSWDTVTGLATCHITITYPSTNSLAEEELAQQVNSIRIIT